MSHTAPVKVLLLCIVLFKTLHSFLCPYSHKKMHLFSFTAKALGDFFLFYADFLMLHKLGAVDKKLKKEAAPWWGMGREF